MINATAEFLTQAEASAAASALEGGDLVVVDQRSEIVEEAPPPPYNTAALLEDATARLEWEAAKVMQVAQRLFEGIELYGVHTGLITYHRTDSIQAAPEALQESHQVIARLYGQDALPHQRQAPVMTSRGKVSPTPRRWFEPFRLKSDSLALNLWFLPRRWRSATPPMQPTESAHEAIRPTSAARLPDNLAAYLDSDALALYRLIWERFIASQMKPTRYRLTTVELEAQT